MCKNAPVPFYTPPVSYTHLAPVCKKVLAGPLTPTRGKVETTDHPPIHPTGQGDPTTLDGGQLKLYNLIARRFLATLMGPATIENTKPVSYTHLGSREPCREHPGVHGRRR